jgi:hypothetical protein
MLAERDNLQSYEHTSEMWQKGNRYMEFIRDLSFSSLLNIRIHTGFFTGVPWFSHAHQPYRNWNDVDKNQIPLVKLYEFYTECIPQNYWCSEPVTTDETELTGIWYKNRLITDDLIRYQRCVSNLFSSGSFNLLNQIGGKPVVLEIGAGYGGLAHQIGNMCKCSYIIVDIPESLFWSSVYLTLNNPEKKIFIYSPETGRILSQVVEDYDYIFIPNYNTRSLETVEAINLGINLLSFQEMSEKQVRDYCGLMSKKLKGYFYSENFHRHWLNQELRISVDSILAEYFFLVPDNSFYEQSGNSGSVWDLYTYLGTSKAMPMPFRFAADYLFTPNQKITINCRTDS